MDKVMPTISDTFVDTGYNFLGFAELNGTKRLFRHLALRFRNCFFFQPEESGVADERAIGKGCKLFQSHIYANRVACCGQQLIFDVTSEAYKPFSILPTDGTSLDCSQDRSMQLDINRTDLGELEAMVSDSEAALGIGERIIPISAFESRIPWFITRLEPAKECFECKVNADGYILKNLRMHILKLRPRLSKYFQSSLLFKARRAVVSGLIFLFSVGEQPIVSVPTGT